MIQTQEKQQTVVRREDMGLTIGGTRLTLYDIMDYLKADWPVKRIQTLFKLSDQQMADIIEYIDVNREEVETEYQLVLKQAEENRRYWEERNRERFAQIAAMPPKPGQEELRAKLKEWKERLAAERSSS